MNIFFLDRDPVKAAEYHVDKHVVKMIQETAQLLSTAHRVLDGFWSKNVLNPTAYRNLCTMGYTGRVDCTARLLQGEGIVFDTNVREWIIANKQAMMMTHVNHPCAIWARESKGNYDWLYQLFIALCNEKQHRWPNGPNDTLKRYGEFLSHPPKNLNEERFTDPPQAMPAAYKVTEGKHPAVEAYRNYYVGDKYHFAKWTNRSIPGWFLKRIPNVWTDPEPRVRLLSDPAVAKKTQITLRHVKKYLPGFTLTA